MVLEAYSTKDNYKISSKHKNQIFSVSTKPKSTKKCMKGRTSSSVATTTTGTSVNAQQGTQVLPSLPNMLPSTLSRTWTRIFTASKEEYSPLNMKSFSSLLSISHQQETKILKDYPTKFNTVKHLKIFATIK